MIKKNGDYVQHSPTYSRGIERVFEDAQQTGEIKLSSRNLKEYPKIASNYDVADMISVGKIQSVTVGVWLRFGFAFGFDFDLFYTYHLYTPSHLHTPYHLYIDEITPIGYRPRVVTLICTWILK